MARGRSDLARLPTVMGEAHDLVEPEPFTTLVLDRVAGSLGCEFASYGELDVTTGESPVYILNSYEEALATWPIPPMRPFTRVERDGERLVVETPTRGALVLREEHLASASLTTREREVLSRVADGMSTNEIAHALWVTPATVSKHLEHIYRKLGVTGRTAALAALQRSRTT